MPIPFVCVLLGMSCQSVDEPTLGRAALTNPLSAEFRAENHMDGTASSSPSSFVSSLPWTFKTMPHRLEFYAHAHRGWTRGTTDIWTFPPSAEHMLRKSKRATAVESNEDEEGCAVVVDLVPCNASAASETLAEFLPRKVETHRRRPKGCRSAECPLNTMNRT